MPTTRFKELTEAEELFLPWLALRGVVTIPVAARWCFRTSPQMTARYFRKLVSHGLIRPIGHGRTGYYVLTAAGARRSGSGLRPARISGLLPELRHSVATTEAIEVLAEKYQSAIVTERQLRADRLRRQRRGESVEGRVPDGLLVGHGQTWAVEVDYTAKRSVHLRKLIVEYLPYIGEGNDSYTGILWLAPSQQGTERYSRVVQSLSAADVVVVLSLQEVLA